MPRWRRLQRRRRRRLRRRRRRQHQRHRRQRHRWGTGAVAASGLRQSGGRGTQPGSFARCAARRACGCRQSHRAHPTLRTRVIAVSGGVGFCVLLSLMKRSEATSFTLDAGIFFRPQAMSERLNTLPGVRLASSDKSSQRAAEQNIPRSRVALLGQEWSCKSMKAQLH